MAQIIVTADSANDRSEGAVMLRERINVVDLESDHFAAQLVERLAWALSGTGPQGREGRRAGAGRSGSPKVLSRHPAGDGQ
jgi:hypothetical protein